MSGTEHWPLLDLGWSDQGIWRGQQRRPLENHGKIWLPWKFHLHHYTVSWWHACKSARQQKKSVAFPVTNRVKQGCVLAPTLFIFMFSAMLFDAFSGLENGINIWYHIDSSLFNLRRLQAKTKVKTDTVNNFQFADDYVLNITTKANLQNSVDKFSMVCNNFGLTISTKKTEIMHQPVPGKLYIEPNITIKGQRLKVVEKSTYLGSTLSIIMDDEVNTRLAKVSAAFGWLNWNVWNQRGISEVYRAVILTTLLYGWERWTTYQRHITKLNHFHMTCLRKILGITWQKHISDTEVLIRASLPSIYTILMQSQLCWASHVVLMKYLHLPKKLLYSKLSQCKRSQGSQKKYFKDTLNVSSIALNCLEYLAQDRDKWCEVVKCGAKVYETRRNVATELCR